MLERQHKAAKRRGHKVWQFKDGAITEAGEDPVEEAIYCIALNKRNALKKWLRCGVLTIDND